MTLVGSIPFSQRCSRLVELVGTSGEFDRERTVMQKTPTLGWERQQESGTCNQNDLRSGESVMRRPQDSDAFPSAHWGLGERTPHTSSPMEEAPAIPLHTKSFPKSGLQQQPGSAKTIQQGNFTQVVPWDNIHLCPSHIKGLQPPKEASGQKHVGTATLHQNCYP